MIVTILNQKGGTGKTTLALHLAGEWARAGARVTLIDADFVLIPVLPSPIDGWASAEMLALLAEARGFRPQLGARFILNRCGAGTVLARETARALAEHDPPLLGPPIGQRSIFAQAMQGGRLAYEVDANSRAAAVRRLAL